MIRISQLKMPIGYSRKQLFASVAKRLEIQADQIDEVVIKRESIDARRKPDVFFLLTVEAKVQNEKNVINTYQKRHKKDADVAVTNPKTYVLPECGDAPLTERPVICGSGPAGLFCAYYLALRGFRPIVLERGQEVDKRKSTIDNFWNSGKLNPNCNVQFGEGGAGTFSDGKLNTLVKDKTGRIQESLSLFVKMGAKNSILYEQKPHLGTDKLIEIVKNLRLEIIRLGGEVLFDTCLTGIDIKEGQLKTIYTKDNSIPAQALVLATGHSARDTVCMLFEQGITMEPKSFAVGYRVQHKQEMISKSQYGDIYQKLSPAPYKLTAKAENGRGVYSFCMCPGGYVVNASSEEGMLCVNGMSYSDRGSENANSAIIISVTPEDYNGDGPLAGIAFQRELETKAFQKNHGAIPVQRFEDYKKNQTTKQAGDIEPICKGEIAYSNLRGILPVELEESFIDGMHQMDHKIKGFAADDALICGIESRTSSPVRIPRNELGQCNVAGIYPCGEGAGYAGGITSAAADGIYIAEQIIKQYYPKYEG